MHSTPVAEPLGFLAGIAGGFLGGTLGRAIAEEIGVSTKGRSWPNLSGLELVIMLPLLSPSLPQCDIG